MLFPELINDGNPTVKLNAIQRNACNSFNEKIIKGIYKSGFLQCIICGNKDFEEIGAKDRYGLTYRTVICNVCGLIQSDQKLDQKSAQEFYNDEYPLIYFGQLHPSKVVFDSQYERANLIYRFIKPFFPQAKPYSEITILEVGCNAGGILKHFADRGFSVSGLEINAEAVSFAKKNTGLDIQEGSLESVNLMEKPDIIIYSHVLEHLNDPAKELKLIRENLKEGGMLFIEVPGIKNLHQSYNNNLLLYLQNAHVTHFSLITLRNLLNNSGFEIIEADEFIRCICRKAEIVKTVFINDKSDVLDYLRKVEQIRKKHPLHLFRILAFPKQIIKGMLKFIGLYKTFFRLYHMR
jgi:2-polyprenyl-3-methyl-5-hydroxy-6-metoxy-1,4-benzoquinol methylase